MTPLYTDKRPLSWLDLITLALGASALLTGFAGGSPASIIFGLAVMGYVLLFTHGSYDLVDNRLIVRYRVLRVRVVPLDDIAAAQPVKLALVGEAVFIVLVSRRRLLIRPRDPQEFVTQLEAMRKG